MSNWSEAWSCRLSTTGALQSFVPKAEHMEGLCCVSLLCNTAFPRNPASVSHSHLCSVETAEFSHAATFVFVVNPAGCPCGNIMMSSTFAVRQQTLYNSSSLYRLYSRPNPLLQVSERISESLVVISAEITLTVQMTQSLHSAFLKVGL